MAFTADDVADWLKQPVEAFPRLDKVVAAVKAHARKRYDEPDTDDYDDAEIYAADQDQFDQALVMQCAQLAQRFQTPNGTIGGAQERGPIYVPRFDPNVQALLCDFLKSGYVA